MKSLKSSQSVLMTVKLFQNAFCVIHNSCVFQQSKGKMFPWCLVCTNIPMLE